MRWIYSKGDWEIFHFHVLASTLWKIDLRLGVSYSSLFCFWTRVEKWHGNLSCFGREFASSLYSLKCIWKCFFIVWKISKCHCSHVKLLNIYFNGNYELLFSLGCTRWGGRDWQAFLLDVAILLVDLNYVYCVINFFFFNGMKPPFGVFILPYSYPSVLNVTVSSLAEGIYAIWSQSSFQLFLLGMIAT